MNLGPRDRGFSLVGTLVTVVLILLLVLLLFKGSNLLGKPGEAGKTPARADGHGTTVLGASEFAARDAVCQSNLSQVRQSITVYQASNDDQFPAALAHTRLGADFMRCPIGNEPYAYDPATGQVHCPHPGHEKY